MIYQIEKVKDSEVSGGEEWYWVTKSPTTKWEKFLDFLELFTLFIGGTGTYGTLCCRKTLKEEKEYIRLLKEGKQGYQKIVWEEEQ